MAEDTTFTWTKVADGVLPGDYIILIFKDEDHNIWIGSGDGLTWWKTDGTKYIFDRELGNHHREVNSFIREKDGTVWIGTHSCLLVGQWGSDNQLTLTNFQTHSILAEVEKRRCSGRNIR